MLPVASRTLAWSPVPWSRPANQPESFLDRVFGDMDRALREGLTFAAANGPMPLALWVDESAYHVEAEVPGVALEDIEVTLHEGKLTIAYERKPEEGREYLINQRVFGRFERSFTLLDPVDSDRVQATLSHGVLHLNIPKTPEARPKKITIQTN